MTARLCSKKGLLFLGCTLVLGWYIFSLIHQRYSRFESLTLTTNASKKKSEETNNSPQLPHNQSLHLSKIEHRKEVSQFYDESSQLYNPSNEWLYMSINTHSGNLVQIQQVAKLFSHGLFKKENTFLVTEKPLNDDFPNFLVHSWPSNEVKGADGYSQAQYRFLYALKFMLQMQNERKDQNVRWFMLADDDAFIIPKNLLRVVGKYELRISEGKHDRNSPMIIGETVTCDRILGGSTVIMNRAAIEVALKYMGECINTYGLQYYDLTMFNCFKNIILPREYNGKKSTCDILMDEPAFNCCNFRLYCDFWTPGLFDTNSWFDRFRQIATMHYIKAKDYTILRNILPDDFFKPSKETFKFTRQEMETGFKSIALPSHIKQNVTRKTMKEIRNDFKNNFDFSNIYTVQEQIEEIHAYIFNNWIDQSYSERVKSYTVSENLLEDNLLILTIPSSNFEKFRIDNSDSRLYSSTSEKYFTDQNVHGLVKCENGVGEQSFFSCIQNLNISRAGIKWVLVGTETTRARIAKLLNYLKTFDSNEVWFVGSYVVAQDMLVSKGNAIPIGSGIILSRKFVELFQQNGVSELETRFDQLLTTYSMALSSDMFFSHTQEYYCTQGIKDPFAWIEMKTKATELEPTVVTIKPEKTCFTSWTKIHHFFDKSKQSLVVYPGLDYLYSPCNY